jgi:DNA (cytosine-5)-methyltransferase 1
VSRPRLLDLFCGAGGAAVGYHRAGFDVVGVDIESQPNYPFEFIRGDAIDLLRRAGLHAFDAIHASPPCQAFTAMRTMPNAGTHPELVAPTRDLLVATGLPYVIENVVGAPLRNAVLICGTSLGLTTDTHDLARHRLFECNFPVMVPPCAHGSKPVVGFYGDHVRDARRLPGKKDRRLPDMATSNAAKLEWGQRAMGIDWMTWPELVNAIPPVYTEHIGHYLLNAVNARAAA